MDTLDALENESVRSLNLNQLERNSVLKTPRNASEYTSLLNVVADVGELDPVCGEVTPNQILHWKQTPSDTYVPFGWPRKSYWKEMIEVYRSLQRDKGVKGHFRDSRWLTPFRDGSAAETETFFLPSHPWVTTTPLLLSESSSRNEYVILHCECVPTHWDATHQVKPTVNAEAKVQRLALWMLHIIWANGYCRDRPVVVFAGLFHEIEGIVAVRTYEHKYDLGMRLPEGLQRAANEYKNNVMATLTERPPDDLGVYMEQPGGDLAPEPGTDIYYPKRHELLTVNSVKYVEGKGLCVTVEPKVWQDGAWHKRRRSDIQVCHVYVVPVKHAARRDPVVGHQAVVVWSCADDYKDVVGRIVNVDEEKGDTKWRVSYYKEGQEVQRIFTTPQLHGIGCSASPTKRQYWKAITLTAEEVHTLGLRNMTMAEKQELVRKVCGIHGTGFDIINRKGGAHTIQGMEPNQGKGSMPLPRRDADGVLSGLALRWSRLGLEAESVTEETNVALESKQLVSKAVFECDRGCKRVSGNGNLVGLQYESKKVGCPVQYHSLLFDDGTAVVGQTKPHRAHGEGVDQFTKLSLAAREAIDQLRTAGSTPLQIAAALVDERFRPKYCLTQTDLEIISHEKVQREVNRLEMMDRGPNGEREGVKDMAEIKPDLNIQVWEDPENASGDFRAIICSEWQQKMLKKFGGFVLVDSVHSVVRHGCNQLTLMVIDETGRGVPVGFCLTTKEDESAWQDLLRTCFEMAGRDISETVSMSDAAPEIINACQNVGIQQHLLCIFHMLQAIGRKLKECGTPHELRDTTWSVNAVVGFVLRAIRGVANVTSENAFFPAYENMKKGLEGHEVVSKYLCQAGKGATGETTGLGTFFAYLDKYWLPRQMMWAAFRRQQLPQWGVDRANTTNIVENHFFHQKYSHARCRRLSSLRKHVRFLEGVIHSHQQRRAKTLRGLCSSGKQKKAKTLEKVKDWLLSDDAKTSTGFLPLRLVDEGVPFTGIAESDTIGKQRAEFSLSDLSCSCGLGQQQQICIHLEAAAEKFPDHKFLTPESIRAAGEYILAKGNLRDQSNNWFRCDTLSPKGKATSTVYTGRDQEWCTCPVFSMTGNCPHLWAALLYECDEGSAPRELIEQDVDTSLIKTFRLDLTRITLDGLEEGDSQQAPSSATSSRKRTSSHDPRRALLKKAQAAILGLRPSLAPEEESQIEECIQKIQRIGAPHPIQGHSERDLELQESQSASTSRSIGQLGFLPLQGQRSKDSRHRLARGSNSR